MTGDGKDAGSAGTWDYVVIGAGSAGCAVAHELVTKNAGRVLLIEAGGDDRSAAIRVPAMVNEAVKRFDWGYVNEPDPTRGGRSEGWARGRVLGGSSSINGMMFVRGAKADFDRWSRMQIPGWSWDDVAPLFKDLERSDQPAASRGRSGPLSVRTVKRPHALTSAFLTSAGAAGHKVNPDYNDQSQEGVGLSQLSQRNGLRCSAANAFLKPIARNPALTVWKDCAVERLLVSGGTVVGASVVRNGERQTLSGARFILCAGAVGSPKLLLLSGIGDPDALRSLGIEPVVASPEVGCNLMEHPLVRLLYETKIPSYSPTGGWRQMAGFVAAFLCHRAGPISTPFEGIAFLKSKPDLDTPDVQLHFIPLGVQDGVKHPDPLLKVPSITIYANLSYPSGRGRLTLRSADPAEAPRIESRLLDTDDDVDALGRAIALVREIMSQAPIGEFIDREITPGPQVSGARDLHSYVRENTEIAYHVAGTCRMGSDPGAVVAPDLKVNGLTNLWIADASIMPDLISGNTNATCMMIGMKLGRALAGGEA